MEDAYARQVTYLRLSVTDRCNLRCQYCMPAEGCEWMPSPALMTDDEIISLLRDVYLPLGITRIRLTGGEPLVRPGLVGLVRRMAALSGIEDISLSTNAVLLANLAKNLHQAGLNRLNISLDSLNLETFAKITRGGDLNRVLAGIAAAEAAGFPTIKLNTVLVAGTNDDEVPAFADLTRHRPLHVRFIELMPVGDRPFFDQTVQTEGSAVLEKLAALNGLEPTFDVPGNGPARIFRLPGARGTVGVISPMSQSFCHDCNRTRLTADGQIKACLMRPQEQDLLGALRAGASPMDLQAIVRASLAFKPWHHDWAKNQTFTRTMSQIGG